MLQKPADKIVLTEIIESVEGLGVLGTCIMGFEKCPFNHTCAMHDVWEEARSGVLNILNTTTLDRLIKNDKAIG